MRRSILHRMLLFSLFMLGMQGLQAQNYEAVLNGNQESPPVKTVASGQVDITLSGNVLTVNGTFQNLSSPFKIIPPTGTGAHLHDTLAGENGSVMVSLNPSINEDSTGGTFNINKTLSASKANALSNALSERSVYLNIHSEQHPAGELRGQVVPSSDELFFAHLSGDNHLNPVNTPASGGIMAELDGNQLTVTGTFENLASEFDTTIAGGSHLHFGSRDRNGSIAISLSPTLEGNMKNGKYEASKNTYTLSQAQMDSLKANHMYVNIHTKNNQSGEIRGQLNSQNYHVFESVISGANQVPSVTSTGMGRATLKVTGEQLLVRGQFADLTSPVATAIAGGAHLHTGMAGETGPVQVPLNVDLNANMKSGMFQEDSNEYFISDGMKMNMKASNVYLNIHSEQNQPGEIRGQVTPEADELYVGVLSGMNEAPPVLSTGNGSIIVEKVNDSIYVSGTFSDLTSPFDPNVAGGAHLHIGTFGKNGSINKSLDATVNSNQLGGEFKRMDNKFALNASEKEALEAGKFYINIHTQDHQAGELRGQVIPKPAAIFHAFLSGSQEAQPIQSGGMGAGMVAVYKDSLSVTGAFNNMDSTIATSIAGGAHLHNAMAGQNGDVNIPLNISANGPMTGGTFPMADNRFAVSQAQKMMLMNRAMYFNVHSKKHQSGELRGQVIPHSTMAFYANLSGGYEVTPIKSEAYGSVIGEVRNGELMLSGSFQGLSAKMDTAIAGGSHIHTGFAGENGGITFKLNPALDADLKSGEYMAMDNTFTLSATEMENLMDRKMYVNLHSKNFPAGELRGQLTGPAQNTYVSHLAGTNEVPAVNTSAQGGLMAELLGDRLIVTGSFKGLESEFNTNVAGGAHLHKGMAGMNGPVRISLDANVSSGTMGNFTLSNNTFQVADSVKMMLRERMLYANIHSMDNAAGELRGQLLPYANAYFTTSLNAMNEVEPKMTDAKGGAVAEYKNGKLMVSGAFSNLASDFNTNVAGGAHLHDGSPAENGSVAISLNTMTGSNNRSGKMWASANTVDLNSTQTMTLMEEGYYVNIHSTDLPNGELRGQVLNAGNRFPESSMIKSPDNGSMVMIDGKPDQEVMVNWGKSEEPDGNDVVYIWQVAADSAFDNVLVNTNTGMDSSVVLTYGMIDSLLSQNGISEGESAKWYHRVLSSDGSVMTPGSYRDVIFEKGQVTGIESVNAESGRLKAYPNPANKQVQFDYKLPSTGKATISIYNTLGERIHQADLANATQQKTGKHQINVNSWNSGMYIYNVNIQSEKGSQSYQGRFSVVR